MGSGGMCVYIYMCVHACVCNHVRVCRDLMHVFILVDM